MELKILVAEKIFFLSIIIKIEKILNFRLVKKRRGTKIFNGKILHSCIMDFSISAVISRFNIFLLLRLRMIENERKKGKIKTGSVCRGAKF
jgi:hypothetical protein